MARRRGTKKIDYTHWSRLSFATLGLAAGTVGITSIPAVHEPETLLRMRGGLTAYVDGVQTSGDSATIAVGLILVPEGTGTTVLWSPISDADAPWIWVDNFLLGVELSLSTTQLVDNLLSYRSVMDSKAMRIVRN